MEIVNRVAESDILVYDLESLWDEAPVRELDLQPFLHRGLVLREIPFREAVKALDPEPYRGAHVAVFCSTDAIIPLWAFMLVATKLSGIARSVAQGQAQDALRDYFVRRLETEDWAQFEDRIVVIKGCASKIVPPVAYLIATQKLQAHARKIMYGEPCSSVPIWRKETTRKEVPAVRGVAAAGPGLPRPE